MASKRPDRKARPGDKRKTQAVKALAQRKRDRDVVLARAAGKPYRKIAEEIGYADGHGAQQAWRRASDLGVTELNREAQHLQIERYESLLAEKWKAAHDQNHPEQMFSVRRLEKGL